MTAALLSGAGNVTTVNSNNFTGSAVVLAKPANLADGQFLVALIMARTANPTLTLPTGFVQVDDGRSASSPSCIIAVKYVATASSEPTSYTFTWGITARIAGILAIATGLDQATYTAPLSGAGAYSSVTSANTSLVFAAGTGTAADLKICWASAVGTNTSNTWTPTAPLVMAGSTTYAGTTAIMGWLGGSNPDGTTDLLQFQASASLACHYNSIVLAAGSSSTNATATPAAVAAGSVIPTPVVIQQIQYSAHAAISLMALDVGQDASTYTSPLSAYQYVILSPSMYGTVASIRAANPTAKILVYKEAAATITGQTTADEAHSSTGVLYSDALANHPTWFLTKAGARFAFTDYPNAYWMDVGLQAYRDAWIANVKASVLADGFDGVYCDDANFYPGHGVAVDGLEKYTDAQYGAAMRDFMIQVGDAMHSIGKLASMNVGADPWDAPAVALSLTAAAHMDVYMREFWMHWLQQTPGVFMDAEFTSQIQQMVDVEAITNIIANTYPENSTDTLTVRYGRASFLLGWSGRAGSASQSRPVGLYNPYQPDAYRDIGSPKAAKYAVGVAWRRDFTGGTVIVNPSSTTAQLVNLGGTFINSSGASVSSVTVPLGDSAVLLASVPAPVHISGFITIPTPALPKSATVAPSRIAGTSAIPVPMFTSSAARVASPISGVTDFGSPFVTVSSSTSVLILAHPVGYAVATDVLDGGSPSSSLANIVDGGSPAGTVYVGVIDGGAPSVTAAGTTTIATFPTPSVIVTSLVSIVATRIPGTTTIPVPTFASTASSAPSLITGATTFGSPSVTVTSTTSVLILARPVGYLLAGAILDGGSSSNAPANILDGGASSGTVYAGVLDGGSSSATATTDTSTVATIPVPIFTSSVSIYPPITPGNLLINSTIPAPNVAVSAGSLVAATRVPGSAVLPVPVFQSANTVLAGRASATTIVPSPVVGVGSAITVVSPAARGTSSAPTPLASAGTGVTVGASKVLATSIIPIPLFTSAVGILPTAIPAASTFGVSTFASSTVVLASRIGAVAGIPAPSIAVSGNVSLTSPFVAGTSIIPAPVTVAITQAQATPSRVAGTTSIPVPTITSQAASTAAAVVGHVTIPVPIFTSAVLPTPAGILAASNFATPAVFSAAIVPAVHIASASSIPAPAVLAGGSVTAAPSPLSSTAIVPTPTIQYGAGATAEPIVGTTAIPIPAHAVGSGTAVAAPSVSTSAIVSVPQVTTTSTAAPTPASIVGLSTLPTPFSQAGSVLTPGTLAVSSTLTPPIVRTGAGPTPVVTPGVAWFGAPTVNVPARPSATVSTSLIFTPTVAAASNSTAVPVVIVGAGSCAAPTLRGGSTISPATVVAISLVPPPFVAVGFVPPTIMGAVTFYPPLINRTTDERIRIDGRRGVLILFGTEQTQGVSGRRAGTIIGGRAGSLSSRQGWEPGTL